jgi:hypothetical protein
MSWLFLRRFNGILLYVIHFISWRICSKDLSEHLDTCVKLVGGFWWFEGTKGVCSTWVVSFGHSFNNYPLHALVVRMRVKSD